MIMKEHAEQFGTIGTVQNHYLMPLSQQSCNSDDQYPSSFTALHNQELQTTKVQRHQMNLQSDQQQSPVGFAEHTQENERKHDRLPMNSNCNATPNGPASGLLPRSAVAFEDDDIGFDFESSDECSVTNYRDLPIHKHADSFTSSDGEHHHEGSTCSSSFFSDEDDYHDHEDDNNNDDENVHSQREECVLATSALSINIPIDESRSNIYSQRKRIVRFSSCLVTEVRTRPFTRDEEWHQCYYSAHELQRMIDEATDLERDAVEPDREKRCIIAEEEDLDL